MKVVFDTNVLVAAFVTEGACTKLTPGAFELLFEE
jgi:predicted nucleic acid-binding protein